MDFEQHGAPKEPAQPDPPEASLPCATPGTEEAGASETVLADQREAYKSLAADFESFKKRTSRESEQLAAAEKESFIQELLPVVDNLERALSCKRNAASEQLRRGIEMTLMQLDGLIRQHGIDPVGDVGLQFDPHRHEAVSVLHEPSERDGVILKVIRRGYCRGERVFRPAMVIVNDFSHSTGVNNVG